MGAKYILRLDDACPTMDRKKWDRVEEICDKYKIKPIVAVIPNNEDKSMEIDGYDNIFWEKVRNWQNKGWYIALHGYNHVYTTDKSGFLPFNKKSEFAGISYEKQKEKIKAGWQIFQKYNIKANIWVAPSHTFDENTLKVLKEYTNIEIISDGVALFPFKKYGFNWIPQQIWRFRKIPFGVWTGCFHPNNMNEDEFKNLEKFIKTNRDSFIEIENLKYKRFCLLNSIFNYLYIFLLKLKKLKK